MPAALKMIENYCNVVAFNASFVQNLELMRSFNLLKTLALGGAVLFLASCEDDDPETPTIPNEEEVITTLTLTLSSDDNDDVVLKYQDLDGDGGEPPIITPATASLNVNTTYSGVIKVENELEDPAENITEEVEEEGAEHQFFFMDENDILSYSYSDEDENGNPVGIESEIMTGTDGSTTLTIILRHEPDKYAEGVADGDITNAGGETDIEVSFDIDVEE